MVCRVLLVMVYISVVPAAPVVADYTVQYSNNLNELTITHALQGRPEQAPSLP